MFLFRELLLFDIANTENRPRPRGSGSGALMVWRNPTAPCPLLRCTLQTIQERLRLSLRAIA